MLCYKRRTKKEDPHGIIMNKKRSVDKFSHAYSKDEITEEYRKVSLSKIVLTVRSTEQTKEDL